MLSKNVKKTVIYITTSHTTWSSFFHKLDMSHMDFEQTGHVNLNFQRMN